MKKDRKTIASATASSVAPLFTYDQFKSEDEAREAVIVERKKDVLVIAGAGTGKTTLIVSRFVELVAPRDPKATPLNVERLAAITFTRKAAGELKLKIRKKMLTLLNSRESSGQQKKLLKQALSSLDLAYIGTIHSFADRLLKLSPIEAKLSPGYKIAEDGDASELISETVERLLHNSNYKDKKILAAQQWIGELIRAGMSVTDGEYEYKTYYGITGLVNIILNGRDRKTPSCTRTSVASIKAQLVQIDREITNFRSALAAVLSAASPSKGKGFLENVLYHLGVALKEAHLLDKVPSLASCFNPPTLYLGTDFSANQACFDLYKQLKCGKKTATYYDKIYAPLCKILFEPLPNSREGILAVYEEVKRDQEAIDQLDLMIKLREVLFNNKEVLMRLQSKFDHLFIDEAQDNDPLQVEIAKALAGKKSGRLTVIGDLKQSIYRFRRADVGAFIELGKWMQSKNRQCLSVNIKTNFRSRPELIHAFNSVFPDYFIQKGKTGDKLTGNPKIDPIPYEDLVCDPKKKIDPKKTFIHILTSGPASAKDGRKIEFPKLACLLKSIIEGEEYRASEIAVLSRTTTEYGAFLSELARIGVPVQVSGGTLYGNTALVKRYLLALAALARPLQKLGLASLHHLPFSATTPLDAYTSTKTETELQQFLSELRKKRHSRPVLETALDLIEHSLAAPFLSIGQNAEEDLSNLYRMALLLDDHAKKNGLGFDEAVNWAQTWLTSPPKLNPPLRSSEDAIQVMTIHQSKGLEFPVVVLFDGLSQSKPNARIPCYLSDPSGTEWNINTGNYSAIFTSAVGGASPSTLEEQEERQQHYENRRLHYVAATRAKKMLIIPMGELERGVSLNTLVWSAYTASRSGKGVVIDDGDSRVCRLVLEWPKDVTPSKKLDLELRTMLTPIEQALASHTNPARDPGAASEMAYPNLQKLASLTLRPCPPMSGIPSSTIVHDEIFGITLHRALYLHLCHSLNQKQALKIACKENGIAQTNKILELEKDCTRVVLALKALDYLKGEWQRWGEVPFTFKEGQTQKIIHGVIDLLLYNSKTNQAMIFDYKSNRSPDATEIKKFAEQLAWYQDAVLAILPANTNLKAAIILSATGDINGTIDKQ
ncbi:MAG: UvrD-helicase domain-containing protein [Oligoflexia bacterium]|nr:UvrD-helicase domain-containing protein [Oligoflexia bacterium]